MSFPSRLQKSPLVEAIWYFQFEQNYDKPIAEILLSILYSELKKSQPRLELRRLPFANVSLEGFQEFFSFYFVKYQLCEPGSSLIYQIGENCFTFHNLSQYVGWERFREKILELIRILQGCGDEVPPQFCSLRYINFLDVETFPDLSCVQVSLTAESFPIRAPSSVTQVRVEFEWEDYPHILQLATPIEVSLDRSLHKGTVLDVEVRTPQEMEDFWRPFPQQLDILHDKVKEFFFSRVLHPEALQKLGPE